MVILPTQIDPGSAEFAANKAFMGGVVDQLKERRALVAQGGGARAVELHRSRGKLFVRDRITRLLDADSPFLELSQLAAWEMYDGSAPAAGVITGIGKVNGTECVIQISDNGIGFDVSQTDKIFGLFERLHGPHEYEGTGVGLAIVRLVMDKHGGRATVDSAPERGSTFTLVFPQGEA